MIDGYPRVLTIIASVGAGVSAGVFFAFSTFVIEALGRLPTAQAISPTEAINRAAPTPLFMLALLGTAAVCIALSVVALRRLVSTRPSACWPGARYTWLASSAIVCPPPQRCLGLGRSQESWRAHAWAQYLQPWTAWSRCALVTALHRHFGLHPYTPGPISPALRSLRIARAPCG